jgi:hypothetical protein
MDATYPAANKLAEYGSIYPMEADLLRATLTAHQATALGDLLQQYTGGEQSITRGPFTSPTHEARSADTTGLSVSELRALLNVLPAQSPGSIHAIRFLQGTDLDINRAAILTNREGIGWQIFVFHLDDSGGVALEWKSGKLDDPFAVSSAREFQTYQLYDEDVVKFSGCAAHACPDVFAVMLYIPSKQAAFTATWTRGEIAYSSNAGGPKYQYYKMELDRLLAERRGVTQ